MIDLLKKAVYTSLGAAFMTKDKVVELGQKIAKEAKLSEEEGRKFVDELAKKSESAKAAGEKVIKETIEKTLKTLEIPTRQELKSIEGRLAVLESKKAGE